MTKQPRRARPTRSPASATLPPVSRSLAIRLLRSREAVMGYFRPNLRRLGLTEQQWRVLRVLNDNGPTDAKQLATDAVLLPPSLSRIVRDLVRKGLLERRVASDDRRRVEIMITPAGIVALRSGARASVRAYDVIAHRFGSRDLATLLLLLERLEAALAPPRPGTPREK